MKSDLAQRLAVAAVGIPLCVAAVYAGGTLFAFGLALLAGVAMGEYVTMYRARGARAFLVLGIAGASALPVLALAAGPVTAWALAAGYLLLVSAAAMLRVRPEEEPIRGAALTFFGVLYVGGLLSFSVPLRESFAAGRLEGTLLFFLPVAVTWLADTAAFIGGRSWGRRPLAPHISPNKTVEGALSALAVGPLAALAYGTLLLPLAGAPLGPDRLLLLGGLLAAAAIVGDLVESILKRECRVKDSSDLLPGHGGVLDRLDSLLWAFPVTYLFLLLI